MKSPVSKDCAETRVVRKYAKLYAPLVELVDSLQDMEPGGTLVDEIEFTKKQTGEVQITYKARPIQLTIDDGKRRFSLRVDEVAR